MQLLCLDMANGINKVILLGTLGADPDLRQTSNGVSVCAVSIATSETWTDKQGERQEKTEWHKLVAWGKTGELIAQYFGKGSRIMVEGSLQTRSFDDKEGNKRYVTEIKVDSFHFVDKKQSSGGNSGNGGARAAATYDDIPF